jgi:hypothetical protein
VVEGAQAWIPWWGVTGAIAAVAYVIVERNDYSLGVPLTAALAIGVMGLMLVLARFRRGDLPWQPGPRVAHVFAFAGRRSLELYAAQILALAAIAGIWTWIDETDGDDDD